MRPSVAKRGHAQFRPFSSENARKRLLIQRTLTSEVVQQTILIVLKNEASKVGARVSAGSWRLKSLLLREFSGTKKM